MDKNKGMFAVIIALLLIVLGSVGGIGYYLISSPGGLGGGEGGILVSASNRVGLDDLVEIVIPDPIVTNLATTEDGRTGNMARVSLSIGIDNTDERRSRDIIRTVSDNENIVKDLVISVITQKTINDLNQANSREILRDEILKVLQEEFNTNLIVRVIIHEWNKV